MHSNVLGKCKITVSTRQNVIDRSIFAEKLHLVDINEI